MADANEPTAVAPAPESDTKPTAEPSSAPTQETADYRPKLSDEEQLQVLEGRRKRLLKKLGREEGTAQASAPESDLLQKAFLRAAGISDTEEVELALSTARKWGISVDAVVDDEDFQAKLDKHRTTKANVAATADIQGSGNTQAATQSPEYWIAKGTPPTRDQVPDRKTRAKIARAMMGAEKSGKKFYNE